MLDRIVIRGYKCLRNRTSIELRPLTVLTGVNSSGKSSIIQTILMTAQSMQSPFQLNSVALNGPLVQLGTFADVVSTGRCEMTVSFRWKNDAANAVAEPDETELDPPRAERRYDDWSWFDDRLYRETGNHDLGLAFLDTLSLKYCLGTSRQEEGDADQPSPIVLVADFSVSERMNRGRRSRQHLGARLNKTPTSRSEGQLNLNLSEVNEARQYAPIHGIRSTPLDKDIDRDFFPRAESASGVLVRKLMPERLLFEYDAMKRATLGTVEQLVSECRDPKKNPRYHVFEGAAVGEAADNAFRVCMDDALGEVAKDKDTQRTDAEMILAYLSSEGRYVDTHGVRWQDYHKVLDDCLGSLSLSIRHKIGDIISSRKDEFLGALRTDTEGSPAAEWVSPSYYGKFIMGFVPAYFASRVRYLGPLREEPHPAYGGAAWGDPRDVGLRGERTAAVLASFGAESVDCARPSGVTDADWRDIVTVSLKDATRMWLQFLGVADDVSVRALGALGYDLTATAPGEAQSRRLSNLGTGVSQVLPVVVMSLLAPRGSLLLFEQPELHLHPRVQARLADFFYSMTLLGKQCIVESHSEYLVDRIRYLCVAESDSRVADNVRLYFSNRSDKGAVFQQVNVNEHGAIADWPPGFFDESKDNSFAIVQANLAKLRRKQQKET